MLILDRLKAENFAQQKRSNPFPVNILTCVALPFGTIELYSPKYYLACTLGGIVACGVTHATVTPLDLVPTPLSYSFNMGR
jgi:hypothetical protein